MAGITVFKAVCCLSLIPWALPHCPSSRWPRQNMMTSASCVHTRRAVVTCSDCEHPWGCHGDARAGCETHRPRLYPQQSPLHPSRGHRLHVAWVGGGRSSGHCCSERWWGHHGMYQGLGGLRGIGVLEKRRAHSPLERDRLMQKSPGVPVLHSEAVPAKCRLPCGSAGSRFVFSGTRLN